MIVADCSALVPLLLGRSSTHMRERLLENEEALCVPDLIDVEFASALRGLVLGGTLPATLAEDARLAFSDLRLKRFSHQPLLGRIWELRNNFTAYDAAYLALAEALNAPLITCDAALGPSKLHRAVVELF